MANRFTNHSPLFSNDRVYTNDEYTLLVDRSVANENYRRLHHRDIQSIQIVIEPIRKFRLVLYSIGFIVVLLLAVATWYDSIGGGGLFLLILAAPFGGAVLYEILTVGKRCQVFVTTAVQKARLAGLTRVGGARRYMDAVTPLITEAQGELSPEELHAGLAKDREERRHNRINRPPQRSAAPSQADGDTEPVASSAPEPPPIPHEALPRENDEPPPGVLNDDHQ